MLTEEAREQMVEQQVRAWEVLDTRVLDTLRHVPRELFVPAEHRYLAFADVAIPLPHGQHMLRPNVVGRLLQALELTGTERVLQIGAGSGFVTACLAAGSASVHAVEIFPELAELAANNLALCGVRNATVESADAMQLRSAARYDVVALTASLPVYDERFQSLLSVGGRLFVVIGDAPVMEACLLRCVADGAWSRESLFETVIDPLVNAWRPQEFAF